MIQENHVHHCDFDKLLPVLLVANRLRLFYLLAHARYRGYRPKNVSLVGGIGVSGWGCGISFRSMPVPQFSGVPRVRAAPLGECCHACSLSRSTCSSVMAWVASHAQDSGAGVCMWHHRRMALILCNVDGPCGCGACRAAGGSLTRRGCWCVVSAPRTPPAW